MSIESERVKFNLWVGVFINPWTEGGMWTTFSADSLSEGGDTPTYQ